MRTIISDSSRRQVAVFLGIILIGALSIVPVSEGIEAHRGESGPDPDLLYFNSPSVVKKMAMGYEKLLADIYWLRTVQYFGRREEADRRAVRFKNLATFLDITTTLDPGMIDAYRMGAIFLSEDEPDGAGQPEAAAKLLDKGIAANPGIWQLRYDKGFVYYLYLRDYQAAGSTWGEAGRMPESPKWMSDLAAAAFSRGGSIDLERDLWIRKYNESTREDIRENARNRLLSLQVAADIWTLEFLLQEHRNRYGRYPRSLTELPPVKSGKANAVDPLGTPYEYDPANGEVRLGDRTMVAYREVPESYKEDFLERLEQK